MTEMIDDNDAYGEAQPAPAPEAEVSILDELKNKLANADVLIAELLDMITGHEAAHAAKDATIADLSKPQVPRGGIHAGSDLVGGNVDWPARTRGEDRINPTDQY